ncbi:LPS-assembly protein [Chromohalobacter marismortui]|uniref:LPS-assembly protein LptD n=1 Tax=Chromohalobacter marismortui TaxID=42055 RepID=A0A4R7NRS7_9GAMM|nr:MULTISPECIES: LPS-assembly protein LptD [Chromohalobacter]MCI0511280.1 LPS-assembly protein LptD [Chromohalobacter sp.]MCI0592240.1 LPS-assembly protein LptD [Chromohalobacter sp.]TDU23704.1 LPS-assembly protein [Chromohalobacter marismortui]
MGKRLFWTALSGLMVSAAHAAPPAPLPAQQLDWQPWGDQAPNGALCSGRYIEPGYQLSAGDTPRQVRSVSATAAYGDGGATILSGEVVLRRDDTQLEAPRVRVNAARDRAFAEGPTAVRYPGLLVRGGDASMSLESDAAHVNRAHYVIHDQRVRGDAVELRRLPDGRYRLEEASFTTCEPGNGLWRMVGSDVTLNRAEGFGTATHARLEMGDVPVFYWPWLRFPIDDRRQSGFLWPTLGFSSAGLDYTQPYYLNLAPNYDATLSPRWMSEHGAMLGGEFRYLFGSDQGTLEGAYLASDRGGASDNPNDPDDAFEGESRWYIDYRHAGRFSPRLDYQLAYGAASDGRYFDDFGRNFAEQDTDHLLRLARTTYRGDTWRLDARAQGYQKLDYPLAENDKPFYRLPSLTADARWRQDSGFYQEWNSNVTYFWRDVDEQEVPLREAATGSRVHLAPALGWRTSPSWGFFEPRAQLWQTSYELDYGNRQTDRDENPSLTAPVLSVDSGLIFERETTLFGNDWRQTLEPRLYYAYVPERDQTGFPDFDTSERAVSWGQLWSPYRFTGADRLGDVNKLSYGASTRFLEDETGRERLSLSVGQSSYFSNRNIDMNGNPDTLPDRELNYQDWYDATRDRSPVITQLEWQMSERWRSRYTWFYDPDRSMTEKASAYLQYRDPAGHVLNLGYTWQVEGFEPADDAEDRLGYNREDYDVSFAYQALPSLDLIGRFLYDNTNDRALEELAGVQFNDCCAAVQLVWRKWIEDNDTANTIADDYTNRGVFLRFVFKGLGGIGQGADSYFEEAIPGYQATRF